VTGRPPPSGSAARVWTLLAVFWLWQLLPVAIRYQRKAAREAAASGGLYEWPRSIWNRPLLLWAIVLAAGTLLIIGMVAAGIYGDPGSNRGS